MAYNTPSLLYNVARVGTGTGTGAGSRTPGGCGLGCRRTWSRGRGDSALCYKLVVRVRERASGGGCRGCESWDSCPQLIARRAPGNKAGGWHVQYRRRRHGGDGLVRCRACRPVTHPPSLPARWPAPFPSPLLTSCPIAYASPLIPVPLAPLFYYPALRPIVSTYPIPSLL